MRNIQKLKLKFLPIEFSIIKLKLNSKLPNWILKCDLYFISKSDTSVSVLCPSKYIPNKYYSIDKWNGFKIDGNFPFSAVGILQSVIAPLAVNKISILTFSTFETDYIFVQKRNLDKSINVLSKHFALDTIYKIAKAKKHFNDGKKLFLQYANSLNYDLCFQNFDKELKSIDKEYNNPNGALILAYKNKLAIGCVGIRKFSNKTAELKRMFVQKEYRGNKIGQTMLELVLDISNKLNYKKIRLDTLPSMKKAHKLYRDNGFVEIPSYRFNPIKGTIFMQKYLSDKKVKK